MSYAELHCQTNFSFLAAASHPDELVERAHALGYAALAITDECSVAGVVRAHQAAKPLGLPLIIGTRIRLCDGPALVLLATDRAGYGRLCRLITTGRRAAGKGAYVLQREDVADGLPGCLALLVPGYVLADGSQDEPPPTYPGADELDWFADTFGDRGWLSVTLLRDGCDVAHLRQLTTLGRRHGVPLTAAGAVRMHARGRRALLDVLTAIRLNRPLAKLGLAHAVNGERHLRAMPELTALYPPALRAASVDIARRCRFSLDEISYQYPDDVTPPMMTPDAYLRTLTEQGIRQRWPGGCDVAVRAQIEHELTLIADLDYAPYFLTVWDIVRFARTRGILCQGRGSAANSAVCYCLGITEVDPSRMNLLFERFISRERGEPPDIDVDFEHERREEVIQYLYRKYGRERAALTATLISYRPRSALRDVGKAFGLDADQLERLSAALSGWRRKGGIQASYLVEAGFDPDNPVSDKVLLLANTLLGFPRHLSQHVGGFVIAQGALPELVPIENAAMSERTVIQWDKDDLDALGLLKIDVLALGMLSAIRRGLALINGFTAASRPDAETRHTPLTLATIPAEDSATYAMISRADTIGVFQIESRAQMSMLPRLKPACFYDLVIEVAIVRPGPIQGDMVHPYLRRRQGLDPVSYPSPAVRGTLERTLGVPLFQEQVIKLAMVAAGFSPGEADSLRRAMAAWRRRGGLEPYREKLMAGMAERGYSQDFAERIYRQILGFGDYGFPESHAASFALLVYVSAWLKRHHPAAFCAALLNSQPMGFYAPAQLVRDAKEHGVTVRAADVRYSHWDCTLEATDAAGRPALRLGLRMIRGLSRAAGERIAAARVGRGFVDVQDLARRAQADPRDLKALAAADALHGLAGDRHRARWVVAGIEQPLPLFGNTAVRESAPALQPPTAGQAVLADYARVGLSLRQHPLQLLRNSLTERRLISAEAVAACPPGKTIHTAGLVLLRQRPGNGRAVFVTLEDETGTLNLIIWAQLAERQRQTLLAARLLGVWAEVQRVDGVQHLICKRLEDHSDLLGDLPVRSRDFQ